MEPRRAHGGSVSRKRFVTWLLGTSFGGLVAGVVFPVVRYIIPPKATGAAPSSVTLPFPTGEVPPNSGRIFKFGTKPGIVLRTPGGELRAFSAICTHLGYTVQYRSDLSEIWCACHNGVYDLNGRNVSGPPPRPLTPYDVRVRGTQIVVSRKA